MKLLITGCTGLSVGRRTEMSSEASLVTLLSRHLPSVWGDEVTQRPVTPGEDLGDFDGAIVVIHQMFSLSTAPWKWGALWAASQLPHVCVIDDWRWRQLLYTLRNEDLLWRCSHFEEGTAQRAWDAAYPHRQVLTQQYRSWMRKLPCTILSAHPWGDHSLFHGPGRDGRPYHRFEELLCWDPSPLVPALLQPDEHRPEVNRAWALAALQNEDEWLESVGMVWHGDRSCQWQLRTRYKDVIREGGTWDRIPECEVSRTMLAPSTGALVPTHLKQGVPGSGWYRPRMVFAQEAGCVTWGEEVEVGMIGDAHRVHWCDIEHMTDDELSDLRQRQRDQFWIAQHTPADALAEVTAFIRKGLS